MKRSKLSVPSLVVASIILGLLLFAHNQLTPTARAQTVDYTHLIPAFDPHVDVVAAPTGFGTGVVWHVGPNEPNKSFSAISRNLKDGDIVEIDAGTYICDESAVWYANNITIVGVGGRPVFDTTTCALSGDKGIFNPRGTNLIIDNIEFMGAHGASGNDAGIRLDGGGYVYITNSYFHNNQNGVLLTPSATNPANIVVDHSEFAFNGACDGACTHNMYVSSNVTSFVLRFSYSHNSHVGHLVKSRALSNYILYNRIADEADGDSSYNIDIPQGGLTYIIGNLIQQSQYSSNYSIISYDAESPAQPANPIQKLYVSGNTIVNDGNAAAIAVNISDNGLTDAQMINNLVVGVAPSSVVGGSGASKVKLTNNLITSTPGFFDRTNRNYSLTASSPAVDAAVDPGTAGTFSLTPYYEFIYPASGKVRPVIGALDVGGYEYDPNEVITPAPTVTFTAANSTINYNTSASLSWSSTNATGCQAFGAWSGAKPSSGTYTSDSLTSNKTFSITCTGPSGTASKSITITVNDSGAAGALGTYTWQSIPGSTLESVCAANLKDSSGNYIYKDNFGTGPYCESLAGGVGVYDPDTQTWYLIGGGGGRNYYGNETYGYNLATQQPLRITNPTHISQTAEYVPTDIYGNELHMPGCNTLVHLTTGGTTIAPRSQWASSAVYNPVTKTIIVGPGGTNNGDQGCSPTINGVGYFGQSATDAWSFNPLAAGGSTPVDPSKVWTQLSDTNPNFTSVTPPAWIFDPATGIGYVAGNRNYFGGYFINYSKVQQNPPTALVNNVWPFGLNIFGQPSVDTTNHYALVMGQGKMEMWNLNGLSMTAYGTLGKVGSTGIAGGPGPLFQPDMAWTVTGDTTILSDTHNPGITYNPNLGAFVAWAGDTKVYFMYPNYQTKVLNVISKSSMTGGPTDTTEDLNGRFTYIPDRDLYLVFTGFDNPIYYLVPPTSTVPPPDTTPTATLTASPTSITSGSSATLTWSSTDATSCTGTGFTASGTSGSVPLAPTVTTTYSVTCTGTGGTSLAVSTTVTVSSTIPATFIIGSRVMSTANLNVRNKANIKSGKILCVQPVGALGTIVAGPSGAQGYTWWDVNFDTSCSGWVVQNYLTATLSSNPTASLSSSPVGAITHSLAQGWTGPEVSFLQSLLQKIDHYTGAVTGYFGPLTEQSVKDFQTQHNLAAVGIVGPKTRELLNGR